MVRIDVKYQGSLRCQATHEPSQSTLLTDAPVDNMGKGESFSPTDLVATALGTCMLTLMGIVARRHGIDLGAASVSVEKEMVTAPVRRISRLALHFNIPVVLTAEQKQILENAAMTCPVHKSIHPDIAVPVKFDWA